MNFKNLETSYKKRKDPPEILYSRWVLTLMMLSCEKPELRTRDAPKLEGAPCFAD